MSLWSNLEDMRRSYLDFAEKLFCDELSGTDGAPYLLSAHQGLKSKQVNTFVSKTGLGLTGCVCLGWCLRVWRRWVGCSLNLPGVERTFASMASFHASWTSQHMCRSFQFFMNICLPNQVFSFRRSESLTCLHFLSVCCVRRPGLTPQSHTTGHFTAVLIRYFLLFSLLISFDF